MEISAVIIYMKYIYKPLQINPFSQLPWKMVKPVGVAVRGKKWGAINQSDVVCVDILQVPTDPINTQRQRRRLSRSVRNTRTLLTARVWRKDNIRHKCE